MRWREGTRKRKAPSPAMRSTGLGLRRWGLALVGKELFDHPEGEKQSTDRRGDGDDVSDESHVGSFLLSSRGVFFGFRSLTECFCTILS